MAISQSRIKSLILNRLCLGESEGYRAYSSLRLECNYDFWGTVRINDCISQVFWKNSILHAIPWASDIPASTTMQIPTVRAHTKVWIVMPKQRAVLPSSTACLHSVRSPNLYQKLLKLIKSATKWSRCFLSFYWHDFLGLEGMTYLPVFKGQGGTKKGMKWSSVPTISSFSYLPLARIQRWAGTALEPLDHLCIQHLCPVSFTGQGTAESEENALSIGFWYGLETFLP